MYWLTFVMFLSANCWSVCLLWLITEFTGKSSWPAALGLAFATYSLLLTGYPQMTILLAYMIVAYTLIRLGQMRSPLREKFWTALELFGCAGVGALAALPVYLDLFAMAQDSARLSGVHDSFFLAVLPPHHGIREITGFVATIFDWSWLGNAISPAFPEPFNGLSFTPVFGSLVWFSFLLKSKRELWFWQVFLLVCLAGTIFPSLYLFAVHHLGFGFSRIQVLSGAIVPGFVLSAYAVDAVLLGKIRLTIWSGSWLLFPLAGEVIVALIVLASDAFAAARLRCDAAARARPAGGDFLALCAGVSRSRSLFRILLRTTIDPEPAALDDSALLRADRSIERARRWDALRNCQSRNRRRVASERGSALRAGKHKLL